jgi:MFS family permease
MSIGWAFLEDRYSRKTLLIGTVGIFLSGLFLTSLSFNFLSFFWFRMMSAAGFGALLPLTGSIIIDLHSSERRTKAFALLGTSTFIGFGAGSVLVGILLGMASWRSIVFILSITCIISLLFFSMMKIPKKGATEKSLKNSLSNNTQHYSFRFRFAELKYITVTRSNRYFIIFFFIHDFVVGTISFYLIPLIRSDFGYDPFNSMIIQLIIYLPLLIGTPYWGKVADRRFGRDQGGKVKTLFSTITIGPLFSILAYSLSWLPPSIFVACLMMFTFITSSATSIAYSILGDINPPELRSGIFSLANLSAIVGRSVGILVCGVLYDNLQMRYSTIFLLWQIIFLTGLSLCLLIPKKAVTSEMENLTRLLEKRASEMSNQSIREEGAQPSTLKDILNQVLENQMKMAKMLKNVTEDQFYLTKIVYYSLELIKRTIGRPDKVHEQEENEVESIRITT